MIQLNAISKTFGKGSALENLALDNISLTILKSDFITIVGSNGAGKSTLMNLLAGECVPDEGHILLEGRDITLQSLEQRAALVSRVFQDPRAGVCEELTLEENLALALLRGKRRSLKLALNVNERRHFQTVLAELGIALENRLHDHAGLLSGGQRQALSLVMATLNPSKLLLLDEHTAALDPKMEKTVLALTQKLIEQYSLTAVMVTHSMSQALEMGNRTLLMRQGKIVSDVQGSARANLTPADLVDFF